MTDVPANIRRTRFQVGATHPALEGHFPGRPLVPGVVVLDEVQRALAAAWPGTRVNAWPQVKFHAPLLPGDWATVTLEPAGEGRYAFRVDRDGEPIASGRMQA